VVGWVGASEKDVSKSAQVLLMEEIPNNHLGCKKHCKKLGGKLPTSTDERRTSEPSTVSMRNSIQFPYPARPSPSATPQWPFLTIAAAGNVWEIPAAQGVFPKCFVCKQKSFQICDDSQSSFILTL